MNITMKFSLLFLFILLHFEKGRCEADSSLKYEWTKLCAAIDYRAETSFDLLRLYKTVKKSDKKLIIEVERDILSLQNLLKSTILSKENVFGIMKAFEKQSSSLVKMLLDMELKAKESEWQTVIFRRLSLAENSIKMHVKDFNDLCILYNKQEYFFPPEVTEPAPRVKF